MDAWELDDLEVARDATGRPYLEFLSVPDLSGGIMCSRRARRTCSPRTPKTSSTS